MNKKEISNDVELVNGRALPGGWSQHEIHYEGKKIGWLESGYPCNFEPGYSFEVVPHEDGSKKTRLLIYKDMEDDLSTLVERFEKESNAVTMIQNIPKQDERMGR